MAALDDANAAIAAIDAATTKQGTVLAAEADTLQKISDEMDAIIAAPNVPADMVAKLQSLATTAQAVSDSLDAQAAFSTAIASKGSAGPRCRFPVPPPSPTPERRRPPLRLPRCQKEVSWLRQFTSAELEKIWSALFRQRRYLIDYLHPS